MRINHNIAALNTYNKLSANQATTSKSLEKLSSGLKINKAGDDAAGLAISEKMRGQIRGLDQASANASDGISLIKTAEGGLNETHSILQRMRELSVQSSNDTNTDADRVEIQKEVNQLGEEIDRISNTTQFNTKNLLDGSMGKGVGINVANVSTNKSISAVAIASPASADYVAASADYVAASADYAAASADYAAASADYAAAVASGDNDASGNLQADGLAQVGTAQVGTALVGTAQIGTAQIGTAAVTGAPSAVASDTLLSSIGDAKGNSLGIQAGDTIEISYVKNGETIKKTVDVTATSGAVTTTLKDLVDEMGTTVSGGATYGANLADGVALTADAAGFDGAVNGLTVTVKNSDGVVRAGATNALSSFTETTSAANVRAEGQATLQIGANTGQNIQVDIDNMGSSALGIKNLKVGNQGQANVAIKVLDAATQKVSAERSKLGSVQNRLEHTINNLGASSENATSAESRIRDVDMAKEMMEFTKNNILSQAAQSMLAQANQQPQGVLQLLQ